MCCLAREQDQCQPVAARSGSRAWLRKVESTFAGAATRASANNQSAAPSDVVACPFWRTAGWCPSQYLLVHARIVTKCVAASDHPSSTETCTTSAASPQIGHHAAESLVSIMAIDCPNRTVVMPDLRSCSRCGCWPLTGCCDEEVLAAFGALPALPRRAFTAGHGVGAGTRAAWAFR